MREPNPLGTCVHYIDPNSRCPDGVPFMPVHCFQGYTGNVDYLECHYSRSDAGGLATLAS